MSEETFEGFLERTMNRDLLKAAAGKVMFDREGNVLDWRDVAVVTIYATIRGVDESTTQVYLSKDIPGIFEAMRDAYTDPDFLNELSNRDMTYDKVEVVDGGRFRKNGQLRSGFHSSMATWTLTDFQAA